MPLFAFEGRSPRIDPTAFVAPTATLIGDVAVEAGASVWFNAVLRGDYGPIVVREGADVQDGSVLQRRQASRSISAPVPRWRTCVSSMASMSGLRR